MGKKQDKIEEASQLIGRYVAIACRFNFWARGFVIADTDDAITIRDEKLGDILIMANAITAIFLDMKPAEATPIQTRVEVLGDGQRS